MATRRGSLPRALPHLRVPPQDHRPQMAALDADDRQVDAVLDRQPEKVPRLLVGASEAELDARPRGTPADIVAVELDRAARRRHVAADQVEERGLAGAVGPEHGATLALGDVEVDVAHREQPAETPADPPQAEGRRGVLGG